MISDTDLLSLNQKGFIPGPQEDEEGFLNRVERLRQISAEQMLSLKEPIVKDDWKGAQVLTHELFDVSTDWVPGFYSNKQLPFWQGAAAWICDTEDGIKLPVLQLKRTFKKHHHLGIYSLDEVLAHEALHASRMMFNEPKFEEFLAYRTSKSFLRKWFGPLFRSSWESYFFVFMLLVPLGVQITRLFIADNSVMDALFYLPWLLIGICLLRLLRTHYTFAQCEKNICPCLKQSDRSHAVLFRLTDKEISLFAKMKPNEIRQYIKVQRKNSLRWRLLSLAYFSQT